MASSRKSIRLEIPLSPSQDRDPVIINYRELMEKKIGELAPASEGESLSATAEDRSQCLTRAQRLRRKYRTWDFPDFRSLGCGYLEDSFIDNTETCDESVVSTVQIKYRVHSKLDSPTDYESDLEFELCSDPLKSSSECESDQSVQIIKEPNETKSQKNVSSPETPVTSVIFKETQKVVCEVSTRVKFPTSQHPPTVKVSKLPKEMDPLHLPISKCSTGRSAQKPPGGRLPVKAQPSKKPGKPRKEEASSSSGLLSDAKCSKVCAAAEPSTPQASRPPRRDSLSQLVASLCEEGSSHPSPDSSSNNEFISKADVPFLSQEPELPDSVLTLLEIVTATDPANMKKLLVEANGKVLFKLSEECRLLPSAMRMHVYEQVAQHWNCAVKTVSRRFGRIKAHVDEQPVKDSLGRLRSRMREEVANVAERGGALLKFTPADSDLVHATLVAKARWLEQHPPRKGSVREALQRFVDAEILPLWAAYGSLAYSSAAFVVREEMRRLSVSGAAPTAADTSSAQRKRVASTDLKSRKTKKVESQ